MRKQRGKQMICCCFARGEKPSKTQLKKRKENRMLIEDKDEEFDSSK